MSASSPLLLSNVSVGYDGYAVASDVSFDLREGEVFGFIGLNGQGKTTLIKTILGLREPLSGDIKVFGDAPDVVSSRHDLAYLPEKFTPSWFMTGYEFVRFSGALYGEKISLGEVADLAKLLAFDVDFLKKRVNTYSKGMGQKIGLIATVLTQGKLLVLDEPMSGLDPLARDRVKKVLETCRESGRTVFLSSHILSDLDELCDRIAVLDSGQVKYIGPPEALKSETKQKSLEKAFLAKIDC